MVVIRVINVVQGGNPVFLVHGDEVDELVGYDGDGVCGADDSVGPLD